MRRPHNHKGYGVFESELLSGLKVVSVDHGAHDTQDG